jgi:hypothetical protein
MADVFISYSKSHLKLTRNLAEELEAKGLTVWWDTDLIASESFRDRIVQEIKTLQGGDRDLDKRLGALGLCGVRGRTARVAGKLIQLRTADVLASAGAHHPRRRGPGGPAFQFQRETPGAASVATGKLRQGGEARADHCEDQPGDAGGDDRHDTLARELSS